jgi:hypothetical protein
MTKTIKIAERYKTIDKLIKVFNKNFLNYAIIPIFFIASIPSLMLFINIHSGDVDGSLSSYLHGLFSFFLVVFTFVPFVVASIMSTSQHFGNKRHFVTSYKTYYQQKLTDVEKSTLENLLDDKFDNIIQENRKSIKKKLKDAKTTMENDILNSEFLEAFKRDIEENLKERKQYIPLLKSFAQKHHARDKDSIIMEQANQYLSKAGLSTFKTKEKTTFEIIEEA